MKRFHLEAGQRYGLLTVVDFGILAGQKIVLCRCDCGESRFIKQAGRLSRGATRSCGCLRVEAGRRSRKHGGWRTPEYEAWSGAKERCAIKPGQKSYEYYGGKGIKVCEQWRASFPAFLKDMGPMPAPGYTLERLDNSQGYEPSNCIWLKRELQSRNRSCVLLSMEKAARIRAMRSSGCQMKEIASAVGVKLHNVKTVLHQGLWALEAAL